MFPYLTKIKNWIVVNQWVGEAVVFLAAAAFYWPLQNNGVFPDPDSFYHLKMAELIAARGPIRDFLWMPFTTLAKNFADQHFLYHVALIPFVKIFGGLRGMKIATAVFAAAAVAAVSFVLRRLGARSAPLFALALAVMNPFVFRVNLAKASAPGIILLVLGMYFAVKRLPVPLFIVAFIYVWTHGGWPALLGLGAVAIVIASWDKGPRATFRALCVPMAALWGGIVAGLVVNPFFPNNLKFYWEQIVQIAVVNYQAKIGVGQEWYPYNPTDLISGLSLLFMLMFVAIALWPFVKGKVRRPALAYSVGAFAFLLLTLRSRRHVEYFVPLAVMAAALWIEPALSAAAKNFWKKHLLVAAFLTLGLVSMFGAFAVSDLRGDKKDLGNGYALDLYKGEAEWLKANVPAGEVIVHADWDDFPPLFLEDDAHRYIMGLDPTFLYSADPVLYKKYVDLTLGRSSDPVGVMKLLNSRYALLDHDHGAMKQSLLNSKKFTQVYEDKDGYIFEMK
jgi:hypothetical protein